MAALAVVGLVLGFAGVGLVVATGSGYLRPPVDLSLDDADAAYGACQRFVRTQLKAPGPVTFAPISRRTVRRYVDGRVRVRSHADVTNAAGRLVEIHITCTMRPLEGDRWDLEGLAVRSD
ncbi:MAG: hypothetical protein ACHQRO_01840 [Vicinamibacteria bacterium]